MLPFFIFLIIVRLILSGTFTIFFSIWRFMLIFVGAVILLITAATVVTSIRQKVSPFLLLKKSIPTFLISITTASSAASFSTNMDTCNRRFGIAPSLTNFGIPLGIIMYKASTPLYYLFLSFYFANEYRISVSVGWIITAVITCVLISVATPPIPGGSAIAYTVLFAQMGIPTDAIAVALSIDIIFDFIQTAVNMYVMPLGLINIGSSTDLLDKKILRSNI